MIGRGRAVLPLWSLASAVAVCLVLAGTGFLVATRKPARAEDGPASRAPADAIGSRLISSPSPASYGPGPRFSYTATWLRRHPSPDLGLKAKAAILVDLRSHQVLWARNAHEARAPASLVKMMTVMVALDHAPDSTSVTVPEAAVHFDPTQDTLMGLKAGERLTVRELLYGIFLASGNDAAETLARTLIPRPDFIEAMNAKAAGLGLRDTHFSNPTGLDAPGNRSSAYDLAVIAGWLETHYPVPVAIAAQPQAWLGATAGHPQIDLTNLNKLVTWPYPGATGLKTGYTEKAGGCVAATAEVGQRRLLAVVLGSPVMFTDAAKLFDYGFAQG